MTLCDAGPLFALLDARQVDNHNRMVALMERYQDSPMDLADASLVVTAERLGAARIFTLDHHFRIYRLADGRMLDIVP